MIWTKENFLSEKQCQDIIDANEHRAEPVDYMEFVDSDGNVNERYDIKERDRLLQNVIDLLKPNLSWFTNEKIYDFSSFDKLNSNVITKGKSIVISPEIEPSIVKTEGNEIAKSNYKPLQTILD